MYKNINRSDDIRNVNSCCSELMIQNEQCERVNSELSVMQQPGSLNCCRRCHIMPTFCLIMTDDSSQVFMGGCAGGGQGSGVANPTLTCGRIAFLIEFVKTNMTSAEMIHVSDIPTAVSNALK